MIFLQLVPPKAHERQDDERAVSGEHDDAAEIVEPFPKR